MYKVIKYFETITDSDFHLGLNVGDILHKISDEKYRLDGTNHIFRVFDCFIEEVCEISKRW